MIDLMSSFLFSISNKFPPKTVGFVFYVKIHILLGGFYNGRQNISMR